MARWQPNPWPRTRLRAWPPPGPVISIISAAGCETAARTTRLSPGPSTFDVEEPRLLTARPPRPPAERGRTATDSTWRIVGSVAVPTPTRGRRTSTGIVTAGPAQKVAEVVAERLYQRIVAMGWPV